MKDDLFERTIQLLEEGSFSATGELLGAEFDRYIPQWHRESRFRDKEEILAEALTCACFNGRNVVVGYLLDHGSDPNGGNKTGLNALHWASNRGHTGTVNLLLEKGADPERLNMYDGTVLGQVLWSAVNEPRDGQVEVIEMLVNARAVIEPGTLEWWNKQHVPSAETKRRVTESLESNSKRTTK